MMNIVDVLTTTRKAAGLSQEALAQAAGLTRLTVQRTESGVVDPRLSTVQEMAQALGLTLMLVPSAVRSEVEAFLQSGGRVLAQPTGAGAPPSVVEELLRKNYDKNGL
ncbi:hypothetical protein GCM10027082_46700 [Comamonas humi]